MADGEDFYTNASPRITNAEIQELWDLGFALQKEHTYGAMAGPIAVYPLHKEKFKQQVMQLEKKENES